MKKLAGIIVIALSLLIQTGVYAENNNDIINKSNTEKAELIEKYLISHKLKIEKFTQKYELEENKEINSKIERLAYLIKGVNKVKNGELKEKTNKTVIIEVLKEIKAINEELKVILVKEKNKYEKRIKDKQDKYSKLALKIALELEKINNALDKKYINGKSVLSLKESKINKSIKNFDKEIKKLKYFNKIQFNSENEMKQSFLRILKNIKNEMRTVKSSIKKA